MSEDLIFNIISLLVTIFWLIALIVISTVEEPQKKEKWMMRYIVVFVIASFIIGVPLIYRDSIQGLASWLSSIFILVT